MRLFVSYARVDKPYCIQIVEMLEVHDIWYDQRLYAGQNWWKEILRRLEWCEGFVYLLSPESINSRYCRREFELAKSLGKYIFPVIVHPEIEVPASLSEIQWVDLSVGLTIEAVKTLLNSIHLAQSQGMHQPTSKSVPQAQPQPPVTDPATVIGHAVKAMESGDFDQAVFLLNQAKESKFPSKFINIDALLKQALSSLNRQSEMREAEREYKQIAILVRSTTTFDLGCEAFRAFHQAFSDYDPEDLMDLCDQNNGQRSFYTPPKIPLLQWVSIPAGEVCFRFPDGNGKVAKRNYNVKSFRISKYPATNTQYELFLDDPYGYANLEWWEYSPQALQWRKKHTTPFDSKFKGDERPREMVTWYDAVAFTNWLSERLSMNIALPSAFEWQRAYQGDDDRLYPWGNQFDVTQCNTADSEIKMTTIVTSYDDNISPYGVYDMVGNVWEWCRNTDSENDFSEELRLPGKRIVRGGSYISPSKRSHIYFHYALKPASISPSIGFRLVSYD